MSDPTDRMDAGAARKQKGLEWIARIYSEDETAVDNALCDKMLVENNPAFPMSTFVETYRPLRKYLDQHGPVDFILKDIDHAAPDRTYASLTVGDEVVFELIVRFEDVAPHRVMYWMSHPPLPEGVEVRRYRSEDAAGVVALEQVCPMEMLDGSQWTVDRGDSFHDYLELMEDIDAGVVVVGDQIIGFFSCALRPIRYHEQDTYCIYQHHYRVHPDYRAGTVSQALASFVDPRRTFASYEAQFPYSMVDPNNAHLQNVGFPAVENVTIARLSLPVNGQGAGDLKKPGAAGCIQLINSTHGERGLFRPYDEASFAARCGCIPSYSAASFVGNSDAVMGIWTVGEVNVQVHDGVRSQSCMHFVLDYGYRDLDAFAALLDEVLMSAEMQGATHLGFLCDTRAEEYELLKSRADDEQSLAVHTLPFTVDAFQDRTVYCDGVYC